MMLWSAAILAAQNPYVDPAPKGEWAAPTARLAARLLPPELAADVVSHEVERPIVGTAPFQIRFFGRAAPDGGGFCERKVYSVHYLSQPLSERRVLIRDEIRLGACSGIFASSADAASAKRALRWLEWAQQVARSERPLPFSLACRSHFGSDRCGKDARAALAALPLSKTFILSRATEGPPHRWSFAITESTPGQALWDVDIDATPGRSSVAMDWKIPAPF